MVSSASSTGRAARRRPARRRGRPPPGRRSTRRRPRRPARSSARAWMTPQISRNWSARSPCGAFSGAYSETSSGGRDAALRPGVQDLGEARGVGVHAVDQPGPLGRIGGQGARQPGRIRVFGLAVEDRVVGIAGVDLRRRPRPAGCDQASAQADWLADGAVPHQAGGTDRWSTSLPTAHIRTAGWARYCSTQSSTAALNARRTPASVTSSVKSTSNGSATPSPTCWATSSVSPSIVGRVPADQGVDAGRRHQAEVALQAGASGVRERRRLSGGL